MLPFYVFKICFSWQHNHNNRSNSGCYVDDHHNNTTAAQVYAATYKDPLGRFTIGYRDGWIPLVNSPRNSTNVAFRENIPLIGILQLIKRNIFDVLSVGIRHLLNATFYNPDFVEIR